ncbi:MAG: DHH family phosphoesterase [Halobacteriaceae archaeon]
MEDWLIDDSELPLERKSLLPGEGFFVPDEVADRREDARVAERAAGADVLVVADPDADGLACVAILRAALGEAALVPAGPHELGGGLARAAEHGPEGCRVFVCDLAPDAVADVADELAALVEHAGAVRWFDHHRWDDDVAAAVRDAGVDLVVGHSEEECTADVALRSLDADLPDRFADLAAVTRDHDLWVNDDPRSQDLADYAHWTDPEEYVDVVYEHGPDLPPEAADFLAERRVEKEALIQRAVDRGALREVGPWTVGVTYGRCSQNEVADGLREEGADAAVVVKPAGSASIRGSEAFEACHLVARKVRGGGHPRAAGCKPDVYEDMLDYAHHWTTQGAVTKQVILDAFRDLARELEAGELEVEGEV